MKVELILVSMLVLLVFGSGIALAADGQKPVIKDVIYSSTLDEYIVQFDAGSVEEVVLKVSNQDNGQIIAESPIPHPDNSFWLIPLEKKYEAGMRIELQDKTGKVLFSYETPEMLRKSGRSPWVESFMDIKENPRQFGILYAACVIPADYEDSRLVWKADGGKAGICSAIPGATYTWQIKTKNLKMIILDKDKVKHAYEASVTGEEESPYLDSGTINVKSPGVMEIVNEAILSK